MSDNLLPDEIISEILSPALKVSDEVFSNTSYVSPFANYSESTSAYLLVCKSWLRVATPLLYNVVILRSKAQAKALSVALSKNKQLGQFIKKLRVEGGYGPSMLLILQCSPNISDLFISFEIYASDNTGGLCKGLPLLNPTRFILRDIQSKRLENKMVSQLIDTVAELMSKWDRLRVFDCPYTEESVRGARVIQPLVKSKRLHTLVVPKASSVSWAYSTFKQCPLQVMRIKRPVSTLERRYRLRQAKTQVPVLEFPHITPSLNPTFKPMAGAPKEVHDAVWARVLYFAMSVPKLADDPSPRKVPRRLPMLLVSTTFNRLGLPHYYTHTVLRNASATSNFASVLSKNPSIGPHVRSLGGTSEPYDPWSDTDDESDFDEGSSEADAMLAILSQTCGLERMSISWDAFEALAKCLAPLTRILCPDRKPRKRVGGYIQRVNRPSDFELEMSVQLRKRASRWVSELGKALDLATSQSFLTILSRMKLKSLRRVLLSSDAEYPEEFLKSHGHKFTELHLPYSSLQNLTVKIFEVCSSLSSISLSMGWPNDVYPDAKDFRASQAVPSLVKIILDLPYWTRSAAAWENSLSTSSPKAFQTCAKSSRLLPWPTSECCFIHLGRESVPLMVMIQARHCEELLGATPPSDPSPTPNWLSLEIAPGSCGQRRYSVVFNAISSSVGTSESSTVNSAQMAWSQASFPISLKHAPYRSLGHARGVIPCAHRPSPRVHPSLGAYIIALVLEYANLSNGAIILALWKLAPIAFRTMKCWLSPREQFTEVVASPQYTIYSAHKVAQTPSFDGTDSYPVDKKLVERAIPPPTSCIVAPENSVLFDPVPSPAQPPSSAPPPTVTPPLIPPSTPIYAPALGPDATAVPQWLPAALRATQAKWGDDKFALVSRTVSVSARTGSPTEELHWRIECFDCPGRLMPRNTVVHPRSGRDALELRGASEESATSAARGRTREE
ncbi:hypothetical protein B0H13DRAFT_1893997 [Mycena leptocephala]|nr:hypothetical protein B0H13DRAFT_1893997 [Mycena leptocephala]